MMLRVATGLIISCWVALPTKPMAMENYILPLPRPLQDGDTLTLAITVGPLRRQRLTISTVQGQYLGSVVPFGVAANQAGGRYMIPVPIEAVHDGRLALRVRILSGEVEREPEAGDIAALSLMVIP